MLKGDAIDVVETIIRETEEFGGEYKVNASALFDMMTEMEEDRFSKFVELCQYLRTLQLGVCNGLLAEALHWAGAK